MASRCFCPPDSFTPRSPVGVSRPSGRERTNSSSDARRSALHDVLVGRAQPPIGDVFANGRSEQEHVLLHDADLAAQRGLRHVADVDAVDGDAAGRHVVEARQQRADRRLAGSRSADEGHSLSGRDLQVEAFEDHALIRIAEADVLVDDIALEMIDRNRVRPVREVGLRVDQRQEAFKAGDALRIAFRAPK